MPKIKAKKEVEKKSVPAERYGDIEQAQGGNEVDVATEKMNKALEVLYNEFGLHDKGYILSSFKDKGNTVALEVFNGEFTLNVTVHDCEKHGINRQVEQEGKDE